MKTTVNCEISECKFNDNERCCAEVISIGYEGCWTCIVQGMEEEVENDS